MKRHSLLLTILSAAAIPAILLSGCGSGGNAAAVTEVSRTESTNTSEAADSQASRPAEPQTAESQAAPPEESQVPGSQSPIRVVGLKGPTTMGLVKLIDDAEKGIAENTYEFTMVTAADELTAMVVGGKADIALLPANVASVLFNRTEGGITVIDINTLGVLYMVSADTSITSMEQLKGRTIYLPGKGTTPEYTLRYLLSAAGLAEGDVTLEFNSEATETASILANDPQAIGMLPQPFVTSALAQNDKLSIIMDMNEVWDSVQEDGAKSRMVTGVTIVDTGFLNENKDKVDIFLKEHEASIRFARENPDTAAELIAAQGIVPKAPLAKRALPYCGISYIDGEEMKEALSGYLGVLYGQDPQSVGGALPGDAFYYVP